MFVEIIEIDSTWGLIACDFKEGANTHLVKTLNKKATVGKYTIKYGSNGIGGGALIMKYSDFTKVGGYTNPDIYIGDDGHLIRSVSAQLKKKCGICEQAILFHPFPESDTEHKYQQWKFKKATNKIKRDKTPNTGFYENQ